jgi:diphthine-ammonia ligase
MLECGMEVILVKVAGVGLGIDLVGKNLREVMPLLRRLVSRHCTLVVVVE